MTPGQSERAQKEFRLAEQALSVARRAQADGALEDASSRLYYAVFHAARACTTLRGKYSKTHRGLIDLFEQEFGIEPLLSTLLEARAAADYDPEKYETTSEQLAEHIHAAEAFIDRCRAIVDEAVARGPDEPDPPPDL